eukprot:CAMPEP_0169062836 /NCGR_PEP_ID=MMETSP1015-20121227/926_1 /TAXON_ID=342587 /ORGANISM="Karlodinium micrum, Strain CCMP2283" /LENGTH=101 /DNA_ID=CAMNT_0009121057 /DNA_START=78 /DNA_END=383 /DNA_ORIENTATION=-
MSEPSTPPSAPDPRRWRENEEDNCTFGGKNLADSGQGHHFTARVFRPYVESEKCVFEGSDTLATVDSASFFTNAIEPLDDSAFDKLMDFLASKQNTCNLDP